MMRALVRLAGVPGPVDVDGVLRVYVDSVEAADSPVFSDNGPFPATGTPDLTQLDRTLNFSYIPLASGDVVFEVEVNPAGPKHAPERITFNNINASALQSFAVRAKPTFAYVPIDYRPSGAPRPTCPTTS